MSLFNRLLVISVISGLFTLWGCSSSDGTGTVTSPIEISYPTPSANLGDMASDTIVTGNILDSATGIEAADIDFIDVNGQFATLDPTDPSRWSVRVPLSTPTTTLNVSLGLAESPGISAISTIEINNNAPFANPSSIAIDTAGNRALVVDEKFNILVAVDMVTGNRTVLSGAGKGSGPKLLLPVSVVLDADRNRALVALNPDPSPSILTVDLASGDRTVLSAAGTGSGELPFSLSNNSIALDDDAATDRNRLLVVDRASDRILAVNLTDGNRTVISDDSNGTPFLLNPGPITVDPLNDRALVFDSNNVNNALLEVDLASGNRTVISDDNTGIGPSLTIPQQAIAIDSPGSALVLDGPGAQIITVDLDSGDRAVLAGTGPELSRPLSLAVDAANNRALVGDDHLEGLLAVDLGSGDRSVFSESTTGAGPQFEFSPYVELDQANNRALMTDQFFPGLLAVDLASGDRTVLADDARGTGPALAPRAFTLDLANNRVLVINNESPSVVALLQIDLATGNRTVISDDNTGSGPILISAESVALDAANNRVLVAEPDFLLNPNSALLAIDLASGDRTVVSDGNTGSGPTLDNPQYVVLDAANNRALVVDQGLRALLAVDLDSGDRTVISDDITGSGPVMDAPGTLALDAAGNRVLVVDLTTRPGINTGTLLDVDLASGNRSVISDIDTGSGPIPVVPWGVALDAANNRALVADSDMQALLVIELGSGERAIVSQ